ncbi:MAG: GNAT family N-acetyltransferase [Saprospiraceae bacterium]
MLSLQRTNSQHPDFQQLVASLDQDLKIRDGDEHAFFAQFNKIDKLNHVILAYIDTIPVGCGAFKKYEEGIIEIKRMYVLPENRGQGIASYVLSELEKWGAELNYQKCVLETGLKQPEAIQLYKKNNYTRIPNYGPYVEVDNSVCFEKLLLSHI